MILLRRTPRTFDSAIKSPRRGVTMTEVLIAIMILGIGMTSLMTLFPIGLMKIREARRNNRASLMADNVASDMKTRDLLNRYSFAATYAASGQTGASLFDVWSADYSALNNGDWTDNYRLDSTISTQTDTGFGIPVVCCYDPLFWSQMAATTSPVPVFQKTVQQNSPNSVLVQDAYRFGRAFGTDIRQTNPSDGANYSAKGLPRVTNIWPLWAVPTDPPTPSSGAITQVAAIFSSQDDPVFPDFENESNVISGKRQNPILPILYQSQFGPYFDNDWDFSWIFTGMSKDRNVFQGDMVIYNKRQFGVQKDNSGNVVGINGERVIEAIFGHGQIHPTLNQGYSLGNSRKVVLILPKDDGSEPVEIKIGQWIADVTYENNLQLTISRFIDANEDSVPDVGNPGQRCHWYRIVQKSEVSIPKDIDPGLEAEIDSTKYDAIVVTVDRPVISKTYLKRSGKGLAPLHINAALIAPEVVAVFPITLQGR